MPTMQASTQVYSFSLSEIKKLIAADLDVPVEAITVSYTMRSVNTDYYDRGPSRQEVSEVSVTVDTAKANAYSERGGLGDR